MFLHLWQHTYLGSTFGLGSVFSAVVEVDEADEVDDDITGIFGIVDDYIDDSLLQFRPAYAYPKVSAD